eukprot:Sdes_comp17550_c0_seq1m6794
MHLFSQTIFSAGPSFRWNLTLTFALSKRFESACGVQKEKSQCFRRFLKRTGPDAENSSLVSHPASSTSTIFTNVSIQNLPPQKPHPLVSSKAIKQPQVFISSSTFFALLKNF